MPAPINSLYSFAQPDGSAGDVTTSDVMGQMNALYAGPGGALRNLRNAIPESPNALSALNMMRGGLGSAANWLQGRPEIGPDTMAPLGLAGMGMAMAPRGALGAMGGGRPGPDVVKSLADELSASRTDDAAFSAAIGKLREANLSAPAIKELAQSFTGYSTKFKSAEDAIRAMESQQRQDALFRARVGRLNDLGV